MEIQAFEGGVDALLVALEAAMRTAGDHPTTFIIALNQRGSTIVPRLLEYAAELEQEALDEPWR